MPEWPQRQYISGRVPGVARFLNGNKGAKCPLGEVERAKGQRSRMPASGR